MALKKEITLECGVKVSYHRIVSIIKITNVINIIEIGSYTDEKKRTEEKRCCKNGQTMNVFIYTEHLSVPYDENLNISNAYDYLKSIDKYAEAKNV